MTTTAPPTTRRTRRAVGDDTAPPGALAGEHALLMRDVTRRATPVLALLETRAWPYAETGTLTGFLRKAVLRRAADEEARLYPRDVTAPPFAELSADHVRLHDLTARLERVNADPGPRQDMRALVEDLLTTLRRHLRDEQRVFAALLPTADVPDPAAPVTAIDELASR